MCFDVICLNLMFISTVNEYFSPPLPKKPSGTRWELRGFGWGGKVGEYSKVFRTYIFETGKIARN